MADNKNNDSFSFVDTEYDVLNYWKVNNIFNKTLEKTKNGEPYIFYDGPPFATGLPHHGHLVGGTLKDIIPRYFTMKGRYVSRRFGWDCHGLPIEHEIDKKLGMSTQDAIEKIGVKGYNDECRGIVQRYTSKWEKTITRMGRWVDFENGYKTMDTTFMESVWWVFNELWNKDMVYQGTKVVPFSTALGTALSNFEAGQNYKDVQDPAVTVLFKLKDQEAYVSAWTTTPWTLPSNQALCTGPDIDYVLVKDEDRNIDFYIAKARLNSYSKNRKLTIIKELKGSEMKGWNYEPLFPYFSEMQSANYFQILNDNYVSTEDGTGVVHIAPGFGEDDNRIMKEARLMEVVCPVDNAGCFTDEITDFKGREVKESDKEIIKMLKDQGKLYDQSVVLHSYPFCWRSDTPLIYRSIPSWYVKVEELVPRLIESNKQINWVPEHIKEGRFGKWLEGARDWAVSRNRVWGTPIPIWINDKTGQAKCIGSLDELEKYTGQRLKDLHKEYVDHLDFSIEGEEGVYKRIDEVFDCWFESGAMPYAQIHYPFENKEVFEKGFPAEFIAEGQDQTRGWFYTLTVLSTALFDSPAFKNVIVNGIVAANDGQKMSKRLKNYTAPDVLMDLNGADALRLYLINSGLVRAEDMSFDDLGVKDMVRRALLPWYNVFKFFNTYSSVDKWNPKTNFMYGDNILDRWILSRLQTLKINIEKEMASYRLYNVVPALFDFIEDLTNTFIRFNRRRFWEQGLSDDKCAAYSTLYTTILELSEAMAPFAPFLSEHIYQELRGLGALEEESVHLRNYPVATKSMIDDPLEEAVDRMKQIILLGRQKRNQVQIKVKTPMRRLTIIHENRNLLNEIQKLEGYIKAELNVKSVVYDQDEAKYINLYAKPNLPVLGKRLGKRMKQFGELINNVNSRQLAELEDKSNIELGGETFDISDFLIFREAKEGTNALSNRQITIDMDTELDQELINEGLAREVVNRIQRTRKDIGLNVDDRIFIKYDTCDELKEVIKIHADYIKNETLCEELLFQSLTDAKEFDIENNTLKIHISKC